MTDNMKNTKIMKNRLFVILMAAVFALPAMAGWINQEQKDATAQQNAFQSTSTMQGSGSAYSANPALNSDGTAAYNAPSEAPSPIRPRREPKPNQEVSPEDQAPIGDAVLPLMLMAAAAAGVIALRRRRTLAKE